jgi:hypothetical protein
MPPFGFFKKMNLANYATFGFWGATQAMTHSGISCDKEGMAS